MSAQTQGIKILSDNRQAGHNYFLFDRYEAGMVLTGTEVKAAKSGKVQLKDAYASIEKGEAWLMNAHISEYSHGNRENHDPTRTRKLLLHRSEINRIAGKAQEKGLTLVPTRMYFKDGRIKVELAVAKGKKLYDKRETERRREADREARQARPAGEERQSGSAGQQHQAGATKEFRREAEQAGERTRAEAEQQACRGAGGSIEGESIAQETRGLDEGHGRSPIGRPVIGQRLLMEAMLTKPRRRVD